ncbi:hypothetical protein GOODEAATRI_012927 [Goodea atripinnis]|uniref:Uncharacterized protein n=1 Tax=Goodea atripinnis TaxID=208336 RepID=A0ABV0P556_9TELE
MSSSSPLSFFVIIRNIEKKKQSSSPNHFKQLASCPAITVLCFSRGTLSWISYSGGGKGSSASCDLGMSCGPGGSCAQASGDGGTFLQCDAWLQGRTLTAMWVSSSTWNGPSQ